MDEEEDRGLPRTEEDSGCRQTKIALRAFQSLVVLLNPPVMARNLPSRRWGGGGGGHSLKLQGVWPGDEARAEQGFSP